MLDSLIQVLTTIRPYYNDSSENPVCADSDEIILDPTPTRMSEADVLKMIELGCVQPSWEETMEDLPGYNPEEGWILYL